MGGGVPWPNRGKTTVSEELLRSRAPGRGSGPGGAACVFSELGIEGRPLRRTRQGNRCRLRAVVVFRFHSRLRLGSWIGFHRRPSPVDLRDRPTHRRTSKNLIQRAARIGARRPESRSLRLGTETTRGRLVSGLSARNDPYRNIG